MIWVAPHDVHHAQNVIRRALQGAGHRQVRRQLAQLLEDVPVVIEVGNDELNCGVCPLRLQASAVDGRQRHRGEKGDRLVRQPGVERMKAHSACGRSERPQGG